MTSQAEMAQWYGKLIQEPGDRTSSSAFYSKRVADILISSALIILLSPIMAAIAIAIRCDSPGPAIFRQQRLGARRRVKSGVAYWEVCTFTVLKFRTMTVDADQSIHLAHINAYAEGRLETDTAMGGDFKLANDARITRIGAILRKTSLDELPQLFNVLKGEMSLVGPRPVPPYEAAHYKDWHSERLAALPGITGLWQVKGRGRVTFEEMIRMDIEYIRSRSLWIDVKLLILTIPSVLAGKGAR